MKKCTVTVLFILIIWRIMKTCKECNSKKSIEEFVKSKDGYRNKCKECKNKKRRTGLLNTGRFKKNNKSWNTALEGSETKKSSKAKIWSKLVKERDDFICQKCRCKSENTRNIHAHHIIPWKDDKLKRFDLDNGLTLCATCHNKEEAVKVAGWNKGLERSETWRKNSSISLKGKKAWNKGIPMSEEAKTKLSESLKGKKAWNSDMKFPGKSNTGSFKKGQVPWNKGLKKEIIHG